MSKKLPDIRLVSVKLEVGGKPAAEGTETLQKLFAPRFSHDAKLPAVCDMDLDFVAFPQFEGFNNSDNHPRRAASGSVSVLIFHRFGFAIGRRPKWL